MNQSDIEQMIKLADKIKDKIDQLDLTKASSASLKKFIDEVEVLQQSITQVKNPIVKMIGVMIGKIKSDHLQPAYEAAQNRETDSVSHFHASDITKTITEFEQEMDVLKNKKNPVYGDAQRVVELGEQLAGFFEENPDSEYSVSIAKLFKENKFAALQKMYRKEIQPVRSFSNGKFDLFEENFIEKCQEYFEDLALNVSKKSKKYLQEAAQVMKGLPEDFNGVRAENTREKDFLDNLPGQTTLLSKIIERELKIKQAAKKTVQKKSAKKTSATATKNIPKI